MQSVRNVLRRIRERYRAREENDSRNDEEIREREEREELAALREEVARLQRRFTEYVHPAERYEAATAMAEELAELSTPQQQIEHLHASINELVRQAAPREDRQRARRIARQNYERAMANPMLPMSWVAPSDVRNIAQTRYIDSQGVLHPEEMIGVNARDWQLEAGENIELSLHFDDAISEDQSQRMTALAMEMVAREIDDNNLAENMTGGTSRQDVDG